MLLCGAASYSIATRKLPKVTFASCWKVEQVEKLVISNCTSRRKVEKLNSNFCKLPKSWKMLKSYLQKLTVRGARLFAHAGRLSWLRTAARTKTKTFPLEIRGLNDFVEVQHIFHSFLLHSEKTLNNLIVMHSSYCKKVPKVCNNFWIWAIWIWAIKHVGTNTIGQLHARKKKQTHT